MLEGGVDFEVAFVLVELDYLYLIVGALDERAQSHSHILPQFATKVNGVEREIGLIGVDLFPLILRWLVQSYCILLIIHSQVLLVLQC